MLIKKRVAVMNNRAFVAAFSSKPFKEAKRAFPDYSFFESEGVFWCVRIGEFNIPWGFSSNGIGFSANGYIVVSRGNVDATSLDGKGLPFVKQGEVSYLYESEIIDDRFEGFSIYLRDALLRRIREIASTVDAKSFPLVIEDSLRNDPDVIALFKSNMLTLKRINVRNLTKAQTENK